MFLKKILFLVQISILIESSIIIDQLVVEQKDITIVEECKNPDKSYLDMIYSEYLTLYRRYEEKVFQKEIKLTHDENNDNDSVFAFKYETNEIELRKKFFEQTQCDLNDRNRTIINQQSLCPWKYVINHRNDKYPFYRAEVKCTCDRCLLKNKNTNFQHNYECQPVFKHVPVLVKSECGPDGYFKWLPSTEEINYACVCATNKKWFPFI